MGQYDPFAIIATLVGLAMLPFVAAMVTSYLKIVVVMSLLRNALGIQSIPPNVVINGLAIILSVYVMAPVVQESYRRASFVYDEGKTPFEQPAMFEAATDPFRTFFAKHSRSRDTAFFLKTAESTWPEPHPPSLRPRPTAQASKPGSPTRAAARCRACPSASAAPRSPATGASLRPTRRQNAPHHHHGR